VSTSNNNQVEMTYIISLGSSVLGVGLSHSVVIVQTILKVQIEVEKSETEYNVVQSLIFWRNMSASLG
jgi:hypothetical protein